MSLIGRYGPAGSAYAAKWRWRRGSLGGRSFNIVKVVFSQKAQSFKAGLDALKLSDESSAR
jgi:hypothetical protein